MSQKTQDDPDPKQLVSHTSVKTRFTASQSSPVLRTPIRTFISIPPVPSVTNLGTETCSLPQFKHISSTTQHYKYLQSESRRGTKKHREKTIDTHRIVYQNPKTAQSQTTVTNSCAHAITKSGQNPTQHTRVHTPQIRHTDTHTPTVVAHP